MAPKKKPSPKRSPVAATTSKRPGQQARVEVALPTAERKSCAGSPRPKRGGAPSLPSSQTTFEEEMRALHDQNAVESSLSPQSLMHRTPPNSIYTPPSSRVEGVVARGVDSDSLLQMLVEGSSTAPVTAAEAIVGFLGSNVEGGVCALLNLLFFAAGVREAEVSLSAVRDESAIGAVLEELCARVPQGSAAYLLINKETRYKHFSRAFQEFFRQVVEQGYHADLLLVPASSLSQSQSRESRSELINANGFFPLLLLWLTAMSESKARGLRHTATQALLSIIHGINVVFGQLAERMSFTKVKKDLTAIQRHMSVVAELRDHIFSQGIHQRVRDVSPEIRLAVIQHLKGWIVAFPDVFITNKYLRYFSMPLHDKRAECRMEGLEMVMQVLGTLPDYAAQLHDFLRYYISRITEMCWDVDTRCAELAIRVVALIVRRDSEAPEGGELLDNNAIDRVLIATLFDERAAIRTAAGILLMVFIHCRAPPDSDGATGITAATELLCAFAATLRAQYSERSPERYLVDAVCSSGKPARILVEYQPILALIRDGSVDEAVSALMLVAALLLKLQGQLCLGPAAKDDRRQVRKTRSSQPVECDAVVAKLSCDVVEVLVSMLVKYRGEPVILASVAAVVAALCLPSVAIARPSPHLSSLIVELRKATAAAPVNSVTCLVHLATAWHALLFSEYLQRAEAESNIVELAREVLLQVRTDGMKCGVTATGKRGSQPAASDPSVQLLRAWGRLSVVAAVHAMPEEWPSIHASMVELIGAGASAPLVGFVVDTAARTLMWKLGDAGQGSDAHRSLIGDMVGCLMKVLTRAPHTGSLASPSKLESTGHERNGEMARELADGDDVPLELQLSVSALVYVCDFSCLPSYTLSLQEQGTLVASALDVCEQLNEQLRLRQDQLKEAVRSDAAAHNEVTTVALARRMVSRYESMEVQVCTGISRLLLLRRISDTLAPQLLLQWTRTPSKAVSEVLKSLFHAMRDRCAESFALEKSVLLAAYTHCANVGATPASIEALGLIGNRLSLVHFLGSDKHYEAVVGVVRFGMEYAATTDPLILQGVTPYCAKLRQMDALQLVRSLEQSNVFPEGSGSNPFIRAFVAALRRAARLDPTASGSALSALPSGSLKRPREFTGMAVDDAAAQVDHMLADIANLGSPSAAAPRHSATSRNAVRVDAPTVISADGWRSRADESDASASLPSDGDAATEATPIPSQSQGAQTSPSATESCYVNSVRGARGQFVSSPALPSGRLNRDEKFIATEEFE